MPIGVPKSITSCRDFFLEPGDPRHRMYEALRAYYLEGRESQEVARTFGYSPGSFRVLCHSFRRDPNPTFFVSPSRGPRTQPKKSSAYERVVTLRKRNYSVYDISEALKEDDIILSPTAVGEVLKEEGFAPLPRRLDQERPQRPHPTVEPVADVRTFSLAPESFCTQLGGLFLLLPSLVHFKVPELASKTRLPGSKMIPAEQALLASLVLKLWSIERKSHIMSLVADPGLALFCGLNSFPKKSHLTVHLHRRAHLPIIHASGLLDIPVPVPWWMGRPLRLTA